MKKILPALICGFAAGVLNVIPKIKDISCCFIIPTAAVLAVWLYLRSENFSIKIPGSFAMILGLLTGVFAAFFGTFFNTLIMFITHSSDLAEILPEIEKMMADLPQSGIWTEFMDLMYKIADDISEKGFSFIYTFYVFFSSLIINSIFGLLGGLLGRQIFINKVKDQQ